MTVDKKKKRAARERAAREGISYTAALRKNEEERQQARSETTERPEAEEGNPAPA